MVQDQLAAIRKELEAIRHQLDSLKTSQAPETGSVERDLRERVALQENELQRLTAQSLRLVELLHEARQEISQFEHQRKP